MNFVKKCKRAVLGEISSKRLYPEDSSGSYNRLSHKKKQKKKVPHGCICVYVGEERERFVIKIKHANHPLFKVLLDDAQTEFGYRSDGPLCLPCHVDLFCEALAEIEGTTQYHDDVWIPH